MQTIVPPPAEPIVENPFGVHSHDVLCGRGAFVNGHVGNQRLRKLALERKQGFDSAKYADKRGLAADIVAKIKELVPPGRFLKKMDKPKEVKEGEVPPQTITTEDGTEWEELNEEACIHKGKQYILYCCCVVQD